MNEQIGNTQTSRQLVKRFYAHLATGDFESVLSCFHPDVEIHEPECLPYGGVYRGLDEAMKLFSAATKFIDVRVLEVEAIIADGDRVVGMIRTAVLGTGESLPVAEESIVRDGKIVRLRVFQLEPTRIIKVANAADTRR